MGQRQDLAVDGLGSARAPEALKAGWEVKGMEAEPGNRGRAVAVSSCSQPVHWLLTSLPDTRCSLGKGAASLICPPTGLARLHVRETEGGLKEDDDEPSQVAFQILLRSCKKGDRILPKSSSPLPGLKSQLA